MTAAKILIVNPNTTASMTETIAAAARAPLRRPAPDYRRDDRPWGRPRSKAFMTRPLPCPPDRGAVERKDADADIVACFDDTGLDAARSAAPFPVVGICEAALVTAGQLARRIAIVTTLPRSIVPLEELGTALRFCGRALVTACNVAVLDLEKPGSGAGEKLRAEIARAGQGAEAIVLGCAGMADLARALSEEFHVPVDRRRRCRGEAGGSAGGTEAHDVARGAYARPAAKTYAGLLKRSAPRSD